MRKANLTTEKHLLSSCTCAVAKHNADVLFKLHDEAVEAYTEFFKTPKRDSIRRKKLLDVMRYCSLKISSDMESCGDENETKPLYRFLRTSAIDRLNKVTSNINWLIGANK